MVVLDSRRRFLQGTTAAWVAAALPVEVEAGPNASAAVACTAPRWLVDEALVDEALLDEVPPEDSGADSAVRRPAELVVLPRGTYLTPAVLDTLGCQPFMARLMPANSVLLQSLLRGHRRMTRGLEHGHEVWRVG